jgi:hypothetical protein
MGGRYVISGVQIGMLQALPYQEARDKVLDEILQNQYIGESDKNLDYDVKTLKEIDLGQS